ncbi:MAG: hypothetical protein DMF60_17925 [Acidobacteria bacterium]|nr:MAG: hypothetical protein DMF60_17925 [Acidobacteriota bacterium]
MPLYQLVQLEGAGQRSCAASYSRRSATTGSNAVARRLATSADRSVAAITHTTELRSTCVAVGDTPYTENRKTPAKFVCVECGFSANADFVGAVNIKEAGLALSACSQPSPAARASWQLTHRSDWGAIVRLRAVGIPSVHGPFTEGRMSKNSSRSFRRIRFLRVTRAAEHVS